MKTFKKLTAALLAIIMVMGLFTFSASAAGTNAPVFDLKIVSQSNSKAVIELSLVSGEFNAFDAVFTTSSNLSFDYIITTDAFNAYSKELKRAGAQIGESTSAMNKKISFASTSLICKPISIYEISVSKKTAADITASDIKVKFTECIVNEKSVASSVKTTYSFGSIEITESVALNYKDSTTIGIDTSLKADSVKWSSSNPSVATVDSNGNVFASGRGSAVITAATEDGTISDTCNVTVDYTWWQWIIVIVLFGWIWY